MVQNGHLCKRFSQSTVMVAYRRNMPQGRQEKGEEMDKIRVAAVQMVSGVSPETNVAAMKRLVARAAEQRTDPVLLPEYWVLMGANDTDKLALAEPLGGGRFQTALSETAKECGVVLFGGTVPLQSPEAGKVMNTLLVYGRDGKRTGLYHKCTSSAFPVWANAMPKPIPSAQGGQCRTCRQKACRWRQVFVTISAFPNFSAASCRLTY